MVLLHYRIQEKPAVRPVRPSVATLLCPPSADVPIAAKDGVGVRPLEIRSFQASNRCQLLQVVCPGFVDNLPIREIVASDLFRDAGFESTFEGVSGEIVSSAELAGAKQDLRFAEPDLSQRLQFSPIHADIVYSRRTRRF